MVLFNEGASPPMRTLMRSADQGKDKSLTELAPSVVASFANRNIAGLAPISAEFTGEEENVRATLMSLKLGASGLTFRRKNVGQVLGSIAV